MKRSFVWYAVGGLALVAAVGLGTLLVRPAIADDAKPAATLASPSPVVAAFPYRYETEFEPDPFDSQRMRRSRTTVNDVIVVRADGTQEIRAASK